MISPGRHAVRPLGRRTDPGVPRRTRGTTGAGAPVVPLVVLQRDGRRLSASGRSWRLKVRPGGLAPSRHRAQRLHAARYSRRRRAVRNPPPGAGGRAPRGGDLVLVELQRRAPRRRRRGGAACWPPRWAPSPPGCAHTHASATWARGTPRAVGDLGHALGDVRSPRPGRRGCCRTRRSRTGRSSASQSRVSRPRASGLHGSTPMPLVGAQRQHLALLLAVQQVVVVLHADEAGPAVQRRRGRAPWRTATRTSTTRRCSAPCRP